MLTKQTIGIVGSGSKATAVAQRLATAQNKLLFFDRDVLKAQALVKQLIDSKACCEPEAIACIFNCAWEADIIILALNFKEQQDAVTEIKEVVNQKILIGISEKDEPNLVAANIATLQQVLPNTKIILLTYDAAKGRDANSILFTLTSRDEAALAATAATFKHAGCNANTIRISC